MIDSNKLKAIMVERGFNQRDLAKLTNVGLNHINEIINNKTHPRLDLVVNICDVLEISDPEMRSSIFFARNVPLSE